MTDDDFETDIDYQVSDHATPDPDVSKSADADAPNKSVLLEIQTYLNEAIDEHNTIDQIDLTEQAKMTPGQQIAVHKVVVGHLRNIKSTVDNKLKELQR